MSIQESFEAAFARSKTLSTKPSNDTLLKMYAYYKQATVGDVHTEKPGGFDFVAAAKHNAWENLKGMSKEDAMQSYILLVQSLEVGQ